MKAFNLYCDPTPEQLETLMASSEHNAAKWIKFANRYIFWRPEEAQHAQVARMMRLDHYEKGLTVPTEGAN